MMNSRLLSLFLILLLLPLIQCVDPVSFKSVDHKAKLVIEGFISNELKLHEVKISRTTQVNDQTVVPERGASVRIVMGNGGAMLLTEAIPGVYQTPLFSGTVGASYQLVVTTSDGKQYTSEAVVMRSVAPIDKVYGQYPYVTNGGEKGIEIFLDTEDPDKKTRFYRWEYEQTYEIQTPFKSKFAWTGGNHVEFRSESVDRCWKSDTLKTILIQSTKGLEKDKITAFPLKFIPESSMEIAVRYSINVKQYSLTEKMYSYWKMVKEVNESQGSLYDIQPGTIVGNISCTSDPDEVVLGYFDASQVTEQRIFLTPFSFDEAGFDTPQTFSHCTRENAILINLNNMGEYMSTHSGFQEIIEQISSSPDIFAILPRVCCNCTDKGTNVEPDFWK